MTPDEENFVLWWQSLPSWRKKDELQKSKRRRAYWMTRRRWCLFGLLENPTYLDRLFMKERTE